jgi:hypothetical protein
MDLIKVKINDKHRLVILDIKDLYVNIPIRETISITKTQFLMYNDKQTTNQIIMLLETILAQNYFPFKTRYTNLMRASPWAPQSQEL